MLTVASTVYPKGWGKLAGKHRIYTAQVDADGRVFAAQDECPITAAAEALEMAAEQVVTGGGA